MQPNGVTLADRGMLPASAYTWPITARWTVQAPWGFTQSEITLEVPDLAGEASKSLTFGALLWSLCVAPATSRLVSLVHTEVMCWRGSLVPGVRPGMGEVGQRFTGAAARDDSPQVTLLTEGVDRASRRRLFLPGAPPGWSQNGLLTREGWEEGLSHVRAMYAGLAPIQPDVWSAWLIAYPGVVAPDVSNFHGVGFRQLRALRLCQHVDRAPDLSLALWP